LRARRRRQRRLAYRWKKPHRDRLFEIEKTPDISALMQHHGYHLALRPAAQERPFRFECDYRPIGKG
jgi:hypothetical protein